MSDSIFNAPGGFNPRKPEQPSGPEPAGDSNESTQQSKEQKNYTVTLSDGEFFDIGNGVGLTKKVGFRLKVNGGKEGARKRVTMHLFSRYGSAEDEQITQAPLISDDKKGTADCECSLYPHKDYPLTVDDSGGEKAPDNPGFSQEDSGLLPADSQQNEVEFYIRATHPECKEPYISPTLRLPLATLDRMIFFHELDYRVYAGIERWEPKPAKNRFIYAFGRSDPNAQWDVWEITTNGSAKFDTLKITKDSYDTRPEPGLWEDVALIPRYGDNEKRYEYWALLSEFRLPKERLFDEIAKDPTTRCLNIDGTQLARKVNRDGEESVILPNYLGYAESLREKVDTALDQWLPLRVASFEEKNAQLKKEKLLAENGELIGMIVESIPGRFTKHLNEESWDQLKLQTRNYTRRKASAQAAVQNTVRDLSQWMQREQFVETMHDYLSLIPAGGGELPQDYYEFEDRVGALLDGLARHADGQELLAGLFAERNSQSENSWVQNLLLLKEQPWNSSNEMTGAEQFKIIRKLSDGAIKILKEAAFVGVRNLSPQELVNSFNRVWASTGVTGAAYISSPVKMSMNNPVRPFAKVFGSFDESSFWRISLPEGKLSWNNAAGHFLSSKGLEHFLVMLEGVAQLINIFETMKKIDNPNANRVEIANDIVGTLAYAGEHLVTVKWGGKALKLGGGTFAAVNAVTSFVDTGIQAVKGVDEIKSGDIDAGIWNFISAGGSAISLAGSATVAASFFTAAAASSATGIGLAPGIVLGFIGGAIAIGGKIGATICNNIALEDFLVTSPWGTKPTRYLSNPDLETTYTGLMEIVNTVDISISFNPITANLLFSQLHPSTVLTLKSVVFGIAQTDRGPNGYAETTIGTNVQITSENALVYLGHSGRYNASIDLLDVCGKKNDMHWIANKPDFVKVSLSVDLFGDGRVILPQKDKVQTVAIYRGQPREFTIE